MVKNHDPVLGKPHIKFASIVGLKSSQYRVINRGLTREEKITLARGHKEEAGLNQVLEVLGLAKSTWVYAQGKKAYEQKYRHLRKPLMEIAASHPEYGNRRTTAELRERGYPVNHKVVEKLHRSWSLSVMKRVKAPKPNPIRELLRESMSQINLVSQMKEIYDLEVL